MEDDDDDLGQICRNCAEELVGHFCAHCGERRTARLEVGPLLTEMKDHLLGLDFRIVHTTRSLMTDPGTLVRGYLGGQRKPYTNPFKSLFLTATLYLLTITLLDIQISTNPNSQQVVSMVVAFVNYLVYLFLIPTAWILRALYRKTDINFAESYVTLCYVWSGYLLLSSILGVAMVSFDGWYVHGRTLVGFSYLTFSLKSVFRTSWSHALIKSLLLYFVYFVAAGIVMSAIIALAYATNFEPLKIPFGG